MFFVFYNHKITRYSLVTVHTDFSTQWLLIPPPLHTTFLVPQLAVTIEAQTLTFTERLRGARVTKCVITCGCGRQITWKRLLEYEAVHSGRDALAIL